jgi:hypothetical protein
MQVMALPSFQKKKKKSNGTSCCVINLYSNPLHGKEKRKQKKWRSHIVLEVGL